MDLPDKSAAMVRDYIEVHGDPFEPWESVGGATEKEIRCHGCKAIGASKWPEWKIQIDHEPDCAWLAFRAAISAVTR